MANVPIAAACRKNRLRSCFMIQSLSL